MKKKIAALLMSLISASAFADEWGTTDTVMLSGALGLLAIDWAQTRKVTTETTAVHFTNRSLNPFETEEVSYRGHYETNPLLGSAPSVAEINRYFMLSMAGTAGAAYVLPPFWRRALLGSIIVVETAMVIENHRIGLRLSY